MRGLSLVHWRRRLRPPAPRLVGLLLGAHGGRLAQQPATAPQDSPAARRQRPSEGEGQVNHWSPEEHEGGEVRPGEDCVHHLVHGGPWNDLDGEVETGALCEERCVPEDPDCQE